MITPIFSEKEYTIDENGIRHPVKTYYGLSTDKKPTERVNDSERYYEKDSRKMSIYDAETKKWYPI